MYFSGTSSATPEGQSLAVHVYADADLDERLSIPITVEHLGGAGPEDYTGVPANVTIPAGERRGHVGVTVREDAEAGEEGEGVRLSFGDLPAGVSAVPDRSRFTITFLDNDGFPAVSASGGSVMEWTNPQSYLRFEVKLDHDAEYEVKVDYATADGTAVAGQDYEPASGTLTFRPGRTSLTVQVKVCSDGIPERSENFRLQLSNAVRAEIKGDGGATGTIRDHRNPNATAAPCATGIVVEDAKGPEPAVPGGSGRPVPGLEHLPVPGLAAFRVRLNEPAPARVTVDYATFDRTAKAGEDYEAKSGTLTFEKGESSKTVDVILLHDDHDDANETFGLRLSNARGRVHRAGHGDGQDHQRRGDARRVAVAVRARGGGQRAGRHRAAAAGRRRAHYRDARHPRRAPAGHAVRRAGAARRDRRRGWARPPRRAAQGRDPLGAHGPDARGDARGRIERAAGRRAPARGRCTGRRREPRGRDGAGRRHDGVRPVRARGSARPGRGRPDRAGRARSGRGRPGARDLARRRWRHPLGRVAGHGGRGRGRRALGRGAARRRTAVRRGRAVRTARRARGQLLSLRPAWRRRRRGGRVARRLGAVGRNRRHALPGRRGGPCDRRAGGHRAGGLRHQPRTRWLAGLALAYSEGAGAYRRERAPGGTVSSRMTSLHPYARFDLNERTRLWATLGYGAGGLSLTPARADEPIETGLASTMAAFGGRTRLAARSAAGAGRFELAVRSDLRFTSTTSDASVHLAGATGATGRVRVLLEGSGSVALSTGGVLSPTVEAGLRYDTGDAETGAGLDIGTGLGYTAGALSVQVNARAMVAHEDAEYGEWGFRRHGELPARAQGQGPVAGARLPKGRDRNRRALAVVAGRWDGPGGRNRGHERRAAVHGRARLRVRGRQARRALGAVPGGGGRGAGPLGAPGREARRGSEPRGGAGARAAAQPLARARERRPVQGRGAVLVCCPANCLAWPFRVGKDGVGGCGPDEGAVIGRFS